MDALGQAAKSHAFLTPAAKALSAKAPQAILPMN
jgi:hypothetical protein